MLWTIEIQNICGITCVWGTGSYPQVLLPHPSSYCWKSLTATSGVGATPDKHNVPRQRGPSTVNHCPPCTAAALLRGKPVQDTFHISQYILMLSQISVQGPPIHPKNLLFRQFLYLSLALPFLSLIPSFPSMKLLDTGRGRAFQGHV